MKTIINIYVVLLFVCFTSCSEESMLTATDQQPIEIAVSLKELTRTPADVTFAPAGGYYLGYPVKSGSSPISCSVDANGMASFATKPIWGIVQNAQKPAETEFTLDNVDLPSIPKPGDTNYDVLWGQTQGWCTNLNFTLEHRMSSLTIELTTDQGKAVNLSKITSVSLSGMATDIKSFDRNTGKVIASDSKDKTINFSTTGTSTVYTSDGIILPPQARNEVSRLKLVVGGTTFEGALPKGMTYDENHYSRTLEFLAGYHLVISAKLVSNGASNKIIFTAATLTPWEKIGTGNIGAKIAGIYNEEDLNNWVTAYNAGHTEDNADLLRYGKWDTSKKMWIFTLYKNIIVSSSSGFTAITSFADSLYSYGGYKITGIDKSTLFTTILTESPGEIGSIRVDEKIFK